MNVHHSHAPKGRRALMASVHFRVFALQTSGEKDVKFVSMIACEILDEVSYF
jgi:hypothetical protein